MMVTLLLQGVKKIKNIMTLLLQGVRKTNVILHLQRISISKPLDQGINFLLDIVSENHETIFKFMIFFNECMFECMRLYDLLSL